MLKEIHDKFSLSNKYNYIHIYKGKFIKNRNNYQTSNRISEIYTNPHLPDSPKRCNKVIVFDLDETIGSFRELILLWNCLENIKDKFAFEFDQSFLNQLIDLYPEFLRYGIITIFEFIQHKKQMNDCYKVYIYTNNIWSPIWPNRISQYINYKLGVSNFFDKTICAFKIKNNIIEQGRTTNKKMHSDFIRCSILPRSTEICFIDDSMHEKMKHDKVYYIQPKTYRHGICCSEIIERFLHFIDSDTLVETDMEFIRNYLYDNFYPQCCENIKLQVETEIDILVTQKMMFYVKEFFYLTTRKTKTQKQHRTILCRFTRKKSV